jgi:hypothetical protein
MKMCNPWLDIPELDYVGHMSSPTVNQRPVLSRLMGDALESVSPRTMLVLGGSTGNGLEHVNPEVTSQVTVVDLNPAYLSVPVRQREPRTAHLRVSQNGTTGSLIRRSWVTLRVGDPNAEPHAKGAGQ